MGVLAMPANCKSCAGLNLKTFNSEVAIHFSGLDGLDKPIVWAFPKMAVCLNCGFTEFVVPERELRVLIEGKQVDGAVVFDVTSPTKSAHAA